jgi:DNA polymerase-1
MDLDLSDAPAKASRLFLVDGNGLAYRAFYALPEELATTEGFPTNALLGVANMLFKLLADYRPQGVLVAWDERPSERLAEFEEYKANRRPTPDLLRQQQPHLKPLVEAFGYRNYAVPGHEADDVIGTLSRLADEAGIPTCVVSTDRDAFQLVSDRVCLMMTPRGVSDVHVYTPERVEARLGVPRELVPDLIGLKGDTSDNIPGVPGIGEKTAADLLRQFGSLEGVYERLGEVPGPKRRESLAAHRDEAFRSKRLGTIRRDLDGELDVDPASVVNAPPDRSRLKELFRQFEFRNLLARVDELESHVPSAPLEAVDVAVPWREVTVDELARAAAVAPVVGLAADEERAAAAVDGEVLVVEAPPAGVAPALDGPALVAHDFKSLPHAFLQAGLAPAFDTYLASYLLDPGRTDYEVDDLLQEHALDLQVGADADTARLVRAAAGAERLREPLARRLDERDQTRLLADIELPLVAVLAAMEDAGVRIDFAVLDEIAARVTDEVTRLEARAYELAGGPFTLGSPKQLGEVLFVKLGLPSDRKGKTGYSTDAKVLAKIRDLHEIVPLVERWRELTKLLSTYLLALPAAVGADGRVHTTFKQATAATGRLSSTDPNLQNIPIRTALGREIRGAFVAEPGTRLLAADYSQVELRILAHLSGEPVLRDAFARGEDVHRATAAEVLGRDPASLSKTERDRAKAVNFGIVYGISSFGLSQQLGIAREEAQTYIDLYRSRIPLVQEFIARTIAETRERGYAVTLFGRRRPVPELRAQNRMTRSLGERLAVNSVIQGSAADIIKVAMVACHRRLRDEGLRARLVLTIHDELLFEVPDEETTTVRALVREEMVGAYPLDPPLGVDVGMGTSWLAAKE